MRSLAIVALVALLAFGAGTIYSRSVSTAADVVLVVPSDTEDYFLHCTIGMKIIGRDGNLAWEENPDTVQKAYENLLNYGIVFEDRSGEHYFTGKAVRRELLKVLRRVLLGGSLPPVSGSPGRIGYSWRSNWSKQ